MGGVCSSGGKKQSKGDHQLTRDSYNYNTSSTGTPRSKTASYDDGHPVNVTGWRSLNKWTQQGKEDTPAYRYDDGLPTGGAVTPKAITTII